MAIINVTSSLSIEQIEENFKGVDFFAELVSGLQEARGYKMSRKPSRSTTQMTGQKEKNCV